MLDECLDYLHTRAETDGNFSYEIVVVDDGSSDQTSEVAFDYSLRGWPVFVLKLERNVGKGGAVRQGVLCSRGSLILFADADGATRFSDFGALEQKAKQLAPDGLETSDVVVVGSRAHLEEESKATRSFLRTFLMVGFHLVVYVFAVRSVRDTQCGFKLFTRSAAAKVSSFASFSTISAFSFSPAFTWSAGPSTWSCSTWPSSWASAWPRCPFSGTRWTGPKSHPCTLHTRWAETFSCSGSATPPESGICKTCPAEHVGFTCKELIYLINFYSFRPCYEETLAEVGMNI